MSSLTPFLVEKTATRGAPNTTLRVVFTRAGIACFLVSLAWLAQMAGFTGQDVAMARLTWAIMSAFVSGIGLGFLLIAHFWFSRVALSAL